MKDILITKDKDGGTAILTTASSQSHYGIPVLRIEGAKDIPDRGIDYGPADIITEVNGKTITGALIIAGWAMDSKRTPAEVAIARLYLSQWPDGPQIPPISSAAALGRKGGSSKSEAKQTASRLNGLQPTRPGRCRGRPQKS